LVAWFLGTRALPWWSYLGLALGVGFGSSGAILLGHELGHKNNRADRIAAQVANSLVGYGHFCIEHNVGHHVHVATPDDCASARMGESIYRFVLREIPGAFRRGWHHECERLAKLGAGSISGRNAILLSWLLTLVIGVAVVAVFGWVLVPFLIIIFSNLLTFHLQRHSDHHANALRPYQTLRDFDNLPRLPSGYPGS
jgi:alkane 1-monooxygenase